MERTITVKGTGRMNIAPDQIEINIELRAVENSAETAVKECSAKLKAVTGALTVNGFDEDEIKTGSFNVSPEYEWNERGGRNQTGFCCSHTLNVKFSLDIERLRKVMDAISSCEGDPIFDVAFTVKDTEAVREDLLRLAADNARQKAKVLCEASGVKLGELVSISYGWENMSFRSSTSVNGMLKMSSAEADVSSGYGAMVPDDILLNDDATFVWKIQ